MTIDTNSEIPFFIPPPTTVVSILSRKTCKPLPRWVHRRSRGEGQYGRLSCGTSDIQSAFCEPGRSTIKIINIFLQFQFWCIGRPVWDFYKKGYKHQFISYSCTFTAMSLSDFCSVVWIMAGTGNTGSIHYITFLCITSCHLTLPLCHLVISAV